MPNKTSGGKSSGGQPQKWNVGSNHHLQNTNPSWSFTKGQWRPNAPGVATTYGATQTFGAQPAQGQLPVLGNPAAQTPQAPVMPPATTPASPEMRQQFQGLNPLVQWLFTQNASRRGTTPVMMYQNWYNRRHGI
jgi:hypothetical protein